MREGVKKSGGLKWPICTILIIAAIGGTIYWGYAKFETEQLMIAGNNSSISDPASQSSHISNEKPDPPQTYRSGLPFYLLAGFAVIMTVILGGILCLWWSLKDWEGGKKYEEEASPAKEQV